MRQTSGDSGALQSLSLGLAVVLRSEVSSVLPDEQFRCKAQSAPLGCPTLPAQVAFIVSPGNFLSQRVGREALSCPGPGAARKPSQFCPTVSWTTSQALVFPSNPLCLSWYPNCPTLSIQTMLSLPRFPELPSWAASPLPLLPLGC